MTEGRCCTDASIHIARSFGYCSGSCMDHQCDVISNAQNISESINAFLQWPLWFYCSRCLLKSCLSHPFHRYLKAIDRFNDLVVSVYVTAGHILCVCDFNCYSDKKNADKMENGIYVIFFAFSVGVYFPWLILHTRLMLLHDSRNDDGIKSFFQEVHELYIKVNHSLLSSFEFLHTTYSLWCIRC